MVRPIKDNSSENWFQADMKAVYTYWLSASGKSGGSLEFFSVLSLLVEMVRPIKDNSSENWFQADMKAVYTYWLSASGSRTLAGRTVCLLCSSTREASVGKYAEASTVREEVLYGRSKVL